jgi:hypothetical protein
MDEVKYNKAAKPFHAIEHILYFSYKRILVAIFRKNNTQTNLDLRDTTLGYGFHFQHRNSRTFPIESLAHDSGSTLVCVEYGYPKGSPNTNS